MPLNENNILNLADLNLEIETEKKQVNQMAIKTEELEKMLSILKLNLHAENTEIRILLRQLVEKLNKVENKQEITIQKIDEKRGFISRLKYLFTGF